MKLNQSLWLFLNLLHIKTGYCIGEKFRTCVYYSAWSYYHQHLPSDLPIQRITNLFLAFPKIDPKTFDIFFYDEEIATISPIELKDNLDQLENQIYSVGILGQLNQLKLINPNLQVSLSIGGSNTGSLFVEIVNDPAKLSKFLKQIQNIVSFFKFDGIDLDWEFVKSEEEGEKLTILTRSLRKTLDEIESSSKNHHLLTLAIPAEPEYIDHIELDVDSYVDFYNIMGYDMSGSWSKITDYHSNIYQSVESKGIDSVVSHLINSSGIDSRKLILGIPNYGKIFKLSRTPDQEVKSEVIGVNIRKSCGSPYAKSLEMDKEDKKECIVDYKLILENLDKCDVYYYDDTTVGCFCYIADKKTVVVFDNPQVARSKGEYVQKRKLGGGMFWDSKGDDFSNPNSSLLLNFIEGLGGVDRLSAQTINHDGDLYVFSGLKNFKEDELAAGLSILWDSIFKDGCSKCDGYYNGYYRSYFEDEDFYDQYHPSHTRESDYASNDGDNWSNSDSTLSASESTPYRSGTYSVTKEDHEWKVIIIMLASLLVLLIQV